MDSAKEKLRQLERRVTNLSAPHGTMLANLRRVDGVLNVTELITVRDRLATIQAAFNAHERKYVYSL